MAIIHKKFADSAPRPKTDSARDPAEAVASVLRRTRKDLGQDLRTVAEVLRIRHPYLEAIEDGAYDRLPGTAYAVGFLRTYADFLGLDGNEMVERFKDESEAAQRNEANLNFPEVPSESRISPSVLFAVPALILAAAIAAWFLWPIEYSRLSELLPILSSQPDDARMSADDPAEEAPPPLAEATAVDSSAAITQAGVESGDTVAAVSAPEPEPAASTQPTAKTEPAATSTAATNTVDTNMGVTKPKPAAPIQPTAKTEPLVTQTAKIVSTPKPRPTTTRPQAVETAPRDDTEIPAARTTSQTAAQNSPPASRRPMPIRNEITVVEIPPPPRLQGSSRPSDGHVSRVYGQQSPDTRIVIRATQESWVQVRNRNDVPLITRVLRAGDTYYVPNRDGLTLVTGNADGLQIVVDSVRLPSLGSVGTDRREIALDPTRLLAGTAVAQ